ncbi:MAG: DMT family transporter [Polyangiaceae bacterium]
MTARRGLRLVLLASLAFATASPMSRLARPAHPILIAAGRVALAAILLAAWDLRGLVATVRGLPARTLARTALAGALLAGHFALFQWGLDRTSLTAAVSLVSLEPMAVVLSAWFFFRIVPRAFERIGLLVATAGAIVVAQDAGRGDHTLEGDLYVLGAVVLFGLYVASARGLRSALPALHYAPLVYAAAGVCLAIILPLAPTTPTAVVNGLSWTSFAWIAALGIIPTTIGHTLVQTGARTLSPSLLALVCPGETLGSIVIGALLVRRAPSLVEGIGAALIIAGALVAIAQPERQGD